MGNRVLQSVSRFAALRDNLSENEYLSQKMKSFSEVFSQGFFVFASASSTASASVYKDPDEEADTRIMRRSALDDNMGAPFDGTPFYGLGTPFDGTPFDGTPFLTDWAHLLRVRLFKGPTRLCKLSRH
ncbi:unnamed protein product [Camellia sinensis]